MRGPSQRACQDAPVACLGLCSAGQHSHPGIVEHEPSTGRRLGFSAQGTRPCQADLARFGIHGRLTTAMARAFLHCSARAMVGVPQHQPQRGPRDGKDERCTY